MPEVFVRFLNVAVEIYSLYILQENMDMSEIETKKTTNKKGLKINKKNTRVDLTPMVDLGFLLITFFVFTTTLSQPTVMNLNMPYDKVKPGDEICESCAITLLLQKDNSIQYYEGMPNRNTIVKTTGFALPGIRNIILQKKNQLDMSGDGESKELVLIIKATNESTYQNFVDIIDEVTINGVKHYHVSEIDAFDRTIFKLN